MTKILGLAHGLDVHTPGLRRSRVRSSGPAKHSFVEVGPEIISAAILSLPLIQEGQLSVTGERMCFKYWLTT